jgi:hypothetical protein
VTLLTSNSVPLFYFRTMQTFDPKEMSPMQTQRLLPKELPAHAA